MLELILNSYRDLTRLLSHIICHFAISVSSIRSTACDVCLWLRGEKRGKNRWHGTFQAWGGWLVTAQRWSVKPTADVKIIFRYNARKTSPLDSILIHFNLFQTLTPYSAYSLKYSKYCKHFMESKRKHVNACQHLVIFFTLRQIFSLPLEIRKGIKI